MIHLRIVAPEEVAHRALEVLEGSPAVLNVVHLHGAAHKPDGDLILCDVAREEASVILGDLKELEIPRVGSIAVERHRDRASRTPRTPPRRQRRGLPSDAVVWEEVEQRTSENTELSVSFVAFMVLAMQIGAVGILLDQPILIVGAMVVGPEFGPLAGLSVALVERRSRFRRRSLAALGVGLPGRHRARLPRDARSSSGRARAPTASCPPSTSSPASYRTRVLLVLRRLRRRGGGDPLADEREVGRADRRAHLA